MTCLGNVGTEPSCAALRLDGESETSVSQAPELITRRIRGTSPRQEAIGSYSRRPAKKRGWRAHGRVEPETLSLCA